MENKEENKVSAFDSLNDRQKDFVLNYIKCRVATRAYLEAYSTPENQVDYDTAKVNASKLLTNPNVSTAVDEKISEIWNNKEKEIGKIFDEFITLGFSDINNIMEFKDGNLTVRDFDSIDTRAIKKIKIREEQRNNKSTNEIEITSSIIEVELHDKKGSLAELADILNLKKVQMEHSGSIIFLDSQDRDL